MFTVRLFVSWLHRSAFLPPSRFATGTIARSTQLTWNSSGTASRSLISVTTGRWATLCARRSRRTYAPSASQVITAATSSFLRLLDLLRKKGADDIKVFGGGGGTITHDDAAIMKRKGVD